MIELIDIGLLKSKLSEELPGKDAQYKMAPLLREQEDCGENLKEAAVLILLYPEDNDLMMVFIKRNEYDGPHSGQISLPGGMKEFEDENFQATALREAHEEIGVKTKDIEIVGSLSKLLIPVSNFCVHPYVGIIAYRPEFVPEEAEVQYLIKAKLKDFSKPEQRKKGIFKKDNSEVQAPYYLIEEEVIWGATAMIMSEFMAIIDCSPIVLR